VVFCSTAVRDMSSTHVCLRICLYAYVAPLELLVFCCVGLGMCLLRICRSAGAYGVLLCWGYGCVFYACVSTHMSLRWSFCFSAVLGYGYSSTYMSLRRSLWFSVVLGLRMCLYACVSTYVSLRWSFWCSAVPRLWDMMLLSS